ncbi:substrate-binding domain-containing protein [Alkalibacterium sp. 20]|uniref:sugar ABC transporter substrate-binding protein n=1 Tax=Alkalibacterium sp. 20 TaxID=1798803 RepID=UPI0009000EF5|nr:substrate-binding domain-containing protein [Alkalibacterium sp. 20]OJF94194.1 sugar ABC transporter substrate-binding protein [Alkalibacterium sp. 20]
MNKSLSILAVLILSVLSYLTYISAESVINSDWKEPLPLMSENQQYRLVLITQDVDTPFWNSVAKGASELAEQEGVMLENLGNYGKNEEAFLSNLELAIHSKVDGIIVQGLDKEKFKELTKIKAAFYGIPVITIAEDVPIEESLRRTYVGSNHFKAGKLIAEQLILDMGDSGEVAIMYDQEPQHYQSLRLNGIQAVFRKHPNISVIDVRTDTSKEKVMATTQNLLNNHPEIEGFVAINSEVTSGMIQEISRRKQIDPLFIYSFDDHADIEGLFQQGKLDAIVAQDPEMMGRLGVELLIEWLEGKSAPLDFDGYFTPITIVKVKDEL